MRVLSDPNVLISAMLGWQSATSAPAIVIRAAFAGLIVSVIAEEIEDETRRTVSRKPHLRRRIPDSLLTTLFESLAVTGEVAPRLPADPPRRCRDAKDDYLLEQAFRAKVDVLLTGDRDLLDLDPGSLPFRIANPSELAAELGLA